MFNQNCRIVAQPTDPNILNRIRRGEVHLAEQSTNQPINPPILNRIQRARRDANGSEREERETDLRNRSAGRRAREGGQLLSSVWVVWRAQTGEMRGDGERGWETTPRGEDWLGSCWARWLACHWHTNMYQGRDGNGMGAGLTCDRANRNSRTRRLHCCVTAAPLTRSAIFLQI
jgi:hypothetical protein